MVNPIPNARQGFDSHPVTTTATAYDPTLNAALHFPIKLAAGDVLASAKTVYSYPNFFDTVCVLTVLPVAPPSGSFRPGPYGKDRTIRWNKSNINYSVLKNFAAVSGAPSQSEIEATLPALPWWEWGSNFSDGILVPWRNVAAGNGGNGQPSTYGREIAFKWGKVALWLNLNNTQASKEKSMIQAIQCGIDIWSYVTNGGGFYHDGGHKCGRKFPVFLAAVALNDNTLLKFVSDPDVFAEDTQTFYVMQSDVGRVVASPKVTYSQTQVGMAEWGVRHRWEPIQDDSRWSDGSPYRFVVWPAMAGAVLAADLMGRSDAWGHPAIFAYNERFRALSGISGFVGSMWSAYKDGSRPPPTITVSSPSFSPPAGPYTGPLNCAISSATTGASINYTTDGTEPTRSIGLAYSSPVAIGVGTTTLKAIAYNGTNLDSAVTTGIYTVSSSNQVSAPVVSPIGGNFVFPQTVSLSTSTAGATIYFTLDGSTPNSQSTVYTDPLSVRSTTTLKAVALKTGMTTSMITETTFSFGAITSTSIWNNVSFPSQSNVFTMAFDVIPSAVGIDAVTGISSASASAYTDLACIIRFATNGMIDSRNGDTYKAASILPYVAGLSYRVVMTVNIATHTYSVTVTPAGQAPVLIADQYAFRVEQQSVNSLGNLAIVAPMGSHVVSNISAESPSLPPSKPTNLKIVK